MTHVNIPTVESCCNILLYGHANQFSLVSGHIKNGIRLFNIFLLLTVSCFHVTTLVFRVIPISINSFTGP